MSPQANHVGLCVTDLARSRRFYEDGLGFRFWWELRAPDEATAPLLQLPPPVGLHAVYLRLGELVLELLHYEDGAHPAGRRRPMDEPGLTHLSLAVDDVDAAVTRAEAHGGTVATRLPDAAMVLDPDGQRIELTSMRWQSALPPPPG